MNSPSPAAEQVATPASAAPVETPSPELTTPKPGSTEIGGNGGPDWRALLAGDDVKALETVSRFQNPRDIPKTLAEQRAEITRLQQQKSTRLPDNATPEQIAEYRKGHGLPDIKGDAKPEMYLDAYKIQIPKGFEATEVQKGMLTDYAKMAYEAGHSPREVKAATDFFFQQEQANTQALNRIAVDYQKTQQNSLRDELGSREYEAQQQAGEAWLKAQFSDKPEELNNLLNARLPGGGLLGDSAWFFKLIAKEAMGAGYTDRIEANALESNGKSLAAQQAEIEGLRRTDRQAYNRPENQDRLKKIIAARVARGEIDEWGNERKRA